MSDTVTVTVSKQEIARKWVWEQNAVIIDRAVLDRLVQCFYEHNGGSCAGLIAYDPHCDTYVLTQKAA